MHQKSIISILLLSLICTCIAQDPVVPVEVEARILRHFEEGEYRKAVDLIEKHLEDAPRDVTMLYNAACGYSLLGDIDRAADYLRRAVEAGFIDFDHMESDPDLDNLRDHPVYAQILEIREEVNRRYAERQLEMAREFFGEDGYRYDTDKERKLNFAIALDETSYREMRTMLNQQADHLWEALFEAPPEYFVTIAVPKPIDAARILRDPEIGGIYEHARRRLIARDIGALLRHEFTHVLHYGHMERLGQEHPLWIQEGIACLYEDYRFDADGEIVFLPNVRHNITKRRGSAGRTLPWRELFEIKDDIFMARASWMYPQVRSIFRFVAAKGKLEAWYSAYVTEFEHDSTGRAAFEVAFGKPIEDVERDWKVWLTEQPLTDDEIEFGDASLGISVNPDAANDGVQIGGFVRGSAAGRSQLRVGDVIVAIDGQSVRSFEELSAIIARHEVGDRLRIRARRRGEYFEVVVRLSRLGIGMIEPTESWRRTPIAA